MGENHTRSEMHGCIVCGALYQLYVVSDAAGKLVDFKVMRPGGRRISHELRPLHPLVACNRHTDDEVNAAVERVYGAVDEDEDED